MTMLMRSGFVHDPACFRLAPPGGFTFIGEFVAAGTRTGVACPQCSRAEIVYNGNYFCSSSWDCGWAMSEDCLACEELENVCYLGLLYYRSGRVPSWCEQPCVVTFELRFIGGPADGQVRVIPGGEGQLFPAQVMEFREPVSERQGVVYERLHRYQRCRVRVAGSRVPWRYEYDGSEIGSRLAGQYCGMFTVLVQTPECMVCRKADEVELPVGPYEAWRGGVHIQEAFPDMPAPEREQLISGTHPACWDSLFGEIKE